MKRGEHRTESTDGKLITLLQTRDMSVVDLSVLFRPLQKKITEGCMEWMVMVSSTIVRKSNQNLQANEEIGASFKLEMVSRFLWKKSSRESSLNFECELSGESDVLSMHQ